ncbi:restriction endonuclease subunit S [Salibacterium qingdaonense]|uniref:Type I restriction modification DNA specificity domain-containing protein n=1 Tax=Salibacterium qingdaonense TaxID=266892 RepID=A0A1I4R000_9BACI|nr:restriction endonuclease subunit S [Salibacterium qingdaonense]SFM45415.1 Type I restriction modification DNA specificity domain-containing protein [Salibacterium qingdaonense]
MITNDSKKYVHKNKGMEWFGTIPDNWHITKLKRIFKLKNGGTPDSNNEEYWEENGIIWITPEDLEGTSSIIKNSRRHISHRGLENSSAKIIQPQSLILSTRAPIGKVKISAGHCTTNQGCKSLEPISCNIEVRYYYFILLSAKEHLNFLGSGTTFPELSNYNLINLYAPFPEYSEQVKIANYIENKTISVDLLIHKNEELIESLKEKRQALITETVTKGLDPYVEMKNSGVEWMGKIPANWTISRLGYESSINASLNP